jgi:hypothetical protein
MSYKASLKLMLDCLYTNSIKYGGIVECLELIENPKKGGAHSYTHQVKLVVTRLIRSNEYVPSYCIMPHSVMFEAVAINIYFGYFNDEPIYTINQFAYLPNSGHYLMPFTGLYAKIVKAVKIWAESVICIHDEQRHANKLQSIIKLELLRKTAYAL